MKIAIVVAAVLVAAWAAVLAIRPDLVRPALAVKSDIYGFAPGMTSEEANKLIAQRKYRCRQVQDSPVVDCNIDGFRVSIALDGAGEKSLVQRITADLGSDRSPEATVRAREALFDHLVWWGEALKAARERLPRAEAA